MSGPKVGKAADCTEEAYDPQGSGMEHDAFLLVLPLVNRKWKYGP